MECENRWILRDVGGGFLLKPWVGRYRILNASLIIIMILEAFEILVHSLTFSQFFQIFVHVSE